MASQAPSLHQRPSLVMLPAECAKCRRTVTLTFQEGGDDQVMWTWTCPYRTDCGRINYISFAGSLTDVKPGEALSGS